MSTINWDQLATKAASQTDEEFNKELASLTNLKVVEVDTFIKESKITNMSALKVLKTIKNATLSNDEKSNTISNIENGVGFLVKLLSRVI